MIEEELEKDESSGDEVEKESGKAGTKRLRNPAYNGLLPISLLAGLIGLLLGTIPAILSVFIADKVFYPLYVAGPLIIYFFNKLLKGGSGVRAIIVNAAFSLACAYLTMMSCQAARVALYYKIPVFHLPTITALMLGRSGTLPLSASAYAYPVVFTALGVLIAAELLRAKDVKNRAAEIGIEEDDEDADEVEEEEEVDEAEEVEEVEVDESDDEENMNEAEEEPEGSGDKC